MVVRPWAQWNPLHYAKLPCFTILKCSTEGGEFIRAVCAGWGMPETPPYANSFVTLS